MKNIILLFYISLSQLCVTFAEIQNYYAQLNWTPSLKLIKVDQTSYISFGKVDNNFIELNKIPSSQNGKIEFSLTNGSKSLTVGLKEASPSTINYAFQITDQIAQIQISGLNYEAPFSFTATDLLIIEKCGGSILFYKNSEMLYAHCSSNTGADLIHKTELISANGIFIDLIFDNETNGNTSNCGGNIIAGKHTSLSSRRGNDKKTSFPAKAELLINIYNGKGEYIAQLSSFTDHRGRVINTRLNEYLSSAEYSFEIVKIKL